MQSFAFCELFLCLQISIVALDCFLFGIGWRWTNVVTLIVYLNIQVILLDLFEQADMGQHKWFFAHLVRKGFTPRHQFLSPFLVIAVLYFVTFLFFFISALHNLYLPLVFLDFFSFPRIFLDLCFELFKIFWLVDSVNIIFAWIDFDVEIGKEHLYLLISRNLNCSTLLLLKLNSLFLKLLNSSPYFPNLAMEVHNPCLFFLLIIVNCSL